jgi:hypothetical protein
MKSNEARFFEALEAIREVAATPRISERERSARMERIASEALRAAEDAEDGPRRDSSATKPTEQGR